MSIVDKQYVSVAIKDGYVEGIDIIGRDINDRVFNIYNKLLSMDITNMKFYELLAKNMVSGRYGDDLYNYKLYANDSHKGYVIFKFQYTSNDNIFCIMSLYNSTDIVDKSYSKDVSIVFHCLDLAYNDKNFITNNIQEICKCKYEDLDINYKQLLRDIIDEGDFKYINNPDISEIHINRFDVINSGGKLIGCDIRFLDDKNKIIYSQISILSL